MLEFEVETQCPFCNHETNACISFDDFDLLDGQKSIGEESCGCGKIFWFEAQLRVDVEFNDSFKKDPRKKSNWETKAK